ncbi:DUF6378 domain-containing protein [Streptomyces cadmiisoli]|uniref:DUF6378 domain-containing protein n=1 Tax=Streptomyces cadmiisoli TaxID=2184053 RepID=A0A2Z4J703_9ACTN|nr:DUF6378 domain-containing protein [Streptomyces cadmiisoli]AWW40776.1 hypothetical protein DN051_32270 [Streptomyces cadmiisoli]
MYKVGDIVRYQGVEFTIVEIDETDKTFPYRIEGGENYAGLWVGDKDVTRLTRPDTVGANLVHGERYESYGDPDVSFSRISKLWSAHLGVDISKRDVALMMILLKVSREKSAHKEDNLDDIEGYVHCARILKEENAVS